LTIKNSPFEEDRGAVFLAYLVQKGLLADVWFANSLIDFSTAFLKLCGKAFLV